MVPQTDGPDILKLTNETCHTARDFGAETSAENALDLHGSGITI